MDIIFERLPNNKFEIPKFATEHSAGLDLSACLTRQCKIAHSNGEKTNFFATDDSKKRTYDVLVGPYSYPIPENPIITIIPNETIMVPLGFKCQFDNDYVGQLYLRSSIGLLGLMLANGVGIIDSDFRGEWVACLYNRTSKPIVIKHGQRIVQVIFIKCFKCNISETKVTESKRGDGGFGSTGL